MLVGKKIAYAAKEARERGEPAPIAQAHFLFCPGDIPPEYLEVKPDPKVKGHLMVCFPYVPDEEEDEDAPPE